MRRAAIVLCALLVICVQLSANTVTVSAYPNLSAAWGGVDHNPLRIESAPGVVWPPALPAWASDGYSSLGTRIIGVGSDALHSPMSGFLATRPPALAMMPSSPWPDANRGLESPGLYPASLNDSSIPPPSVDSLQNLVFQVEYIPEPLSLTMLLLGVLPALIRRRRPKPCRP